MKTLLLYILSFTLLFCKEKDEILDMYQSEIDKIELSKVFDKIDKKYIYKISIQFDEILFDVIKTENKWEISYDGKIFSVKNYLLDGVFYYFNNLEAKRIIHKNKEYWNKYNLDDIHGFKIKFTSNIMDTHKNYVFGINHYNKLKIYSRIDNLSENIYFLNKDAENIYKFLIDICKYFIQVVPLDDEDKYKYRKKIDSKEKLFTREELESSKVFIPYDRAPMPKTPLGDLIIYPKSARKAGIEGKVYVKAFINNKGIVTTAEIIKGIPNTGLDESALIAVKKSRWYPARQRDKKIGVWITIPIDFSLK